MANGIAKGTVIREFNVTELLREDEVFQWVRATEQAKKDPVILQVLKPDSGLSEGEIDGLSDYLNTLTFELANLKKAKGFLIPERITSDQTFQVIAVYKDFPQELLVQKFKAVTESVIEHWNSLNEGIRLIHDRRLPHGNLSPASFLLVNNKAFLGNFGYAPVIEKGHKNILERYGDFLAPELFSTPSPTLDAMKAADIYTFAKTLASWQPEVESDDWYRQATHRDPGKRFKTMREMFPDIEKALKKLVQPEGISDPETSGGTEASGVVETCQLDARVEPPEAAELVGGGRCIRDETREIKATPHPWWRFDHWSGDIEGIDVTENSIAVTIDKDRTLIAHFKEIPRAVLTGTVRPRDRGAVRGLGDYVYGEMVEVKAVPVSGWKFSRWTGGLKGSENPARLEMDSDKKLVAHFVQEKKKDDSPGRIRAFFRKSYKRFLEIAGRAAKIPAHMFRAEEGEAPTEPGGTLLALGSPWTIVPLLAGVTDLAVVWSFYPDSQLGILAGIACLFMSLGIFLTRLLVVHNR